MPIQPSLVTPALFLFVVGLVGLRIWRWEISLIYPDGPNVITKVLKEKRITTREGIVMKEAEGRVRSFLELGLWTRNFLLEPLEGTQLC